MSTQCNRFVQNAWKKELCSNCFKPKEEHAPADDTLRLNVEKASTNLKIDHLQLQSILRGKTVCRKDQRKKNVGFPESLTEVIGYGGDDFSDGEEDRGGGRVDSKSEDLVPDSEEERALFDLTRANTNFNTVTANLTNVESNDSPDASKSSTTSPAKSFASLMLGKIQRDADGRKTTLLVSVTPFGGDESVPTAKRPTDRKINAINLQTSPAFRLKPGDGGSSDNTAEAAKKLNGSERKKTEEQEQKSLPELGKIVDMPLITSANMISIMRREITTDTANADAVKTEIATAQKYSPVCKVDKRNATNVPLNTVSAVKKTEIEISSRMFAQSAPSSDVGESVKGTTTSKSECAKQDQAKEELASLASLKNEETPESEGSMNVDDKSVNGVADNGTKGAPSPQVREVEGACEGAERKKFCFDSSRELAGEPDGKADEEEVTEPPALPTSPPPIITTEPRPSFLHGSVNIDSKAKPAVPQKPVTFSAKANDGPLAARKILNGDYVLPPPSVQTVAGRPIQNLGTQDMSSRCSTKKNVTNEILSEPDQVPPTITAQNSESGDQAKTPSKSAFSPLFTSVTASPASLRNYPTSNEEVDENVMLDEEFPEITPVSVSTMELVRSPNKRRMAPRPPESTEDLLPVSSLFARNPGANLKSDSPVVREKEKRERSSSCSPKFRKAVCDLPDPTNDNVKPIEHVSRRTISLSQDSLTTEKEVREEKKRGRNRKGFSLKRFLRMGTRKDMDVITGQTSGARTDEIPSTPQPKPRLEIIHPLELDGAAVEVVGNDRITARMGEDQPDACGAKNDGSRMPRFPPPIAARPGKPPPPPRNQSLEDWPRLDSANKPVRPPPPRAEIKLSIAASRNDKTSKATWRPTSATTSDSIYANLGKFRPIQCN